MVRRYKMQERALAQDETRDRIVRAIVALHERLGPKATTISAIAREAGVQRLTVYRHFPNDAALFKACSTRWAAENPMPDPALWANVDEPLERTFVALSALYRYFRASRGMLTPVFRDDPLLKVKSPLDPIRAYLSGVADDLCRHYAAKPRARGKLSATLRHAVQFQTWSSFADLELSDGAAAKMVVSWIDGLLSG